MSWPAVVLWLIVIAAAVSPGPALLYLFSISGCFGTLQMIPGELIGGANVLPQSVCAALLVSKIVIQPGNIIRLMAAAIDFRRIGLLTTFLLYSLLSALTLPRLFEGQVEVVPIAAVGPFLLGPSGGNVTQIGYIALSVATALAFCVAGSGPAFQRAFLLSILAGGAALILTGLIDLVSASLGLSGLLDPFRTASYTMFTDNEVLGAKRVVGLMSEASAYGASCVTAAAALTFLRPCFPSRWRRLIVPAAIAGLLLMSALSTSSSAYIGLVIFLVAFGANWLIRLSSPRAVAREDLAIEALILVAAAFALLCVVILIPTLLDPIINMLDITIFEKSSSDSYFVRSMWTRVAWEAFLSTDLLGVGFGGLRTSNWFVCILGNTGVIGAVLMFGFMIRANIPPSTPQTALERELKRALRFSLLPWLVMSWFSGTTPDLGVTAASIYGLLMAATERRTAHIRLSALPGLT